ncbi:MAG TPA: hypothetical protein PKD96_00835 [Candidatus Absconditabacterales bacterium]|nr:hypothetical protein [Candidatus Absconditabacterales bacterium]HMT26825.1 hypothetical protein [Candidatus Absconditabacterales bacterium]
MTQHTLFEKTHFKTRVSNFDNVTAVFEKTNREENAFLVTLEINSQKFVATVNIRADQIKEFELIAIKGFIDLSHRLLHTLKEIISIMYKKTFA